MTTTVAIVGLGSRGLGVLERVVTLAKKRGPSGGAVHVEVIDPTCAGAGVHDAAQPDYLLLNTTCSQVSLFPDSCTVGDDVDAPGPSLHEWVMSRGLRIGDDGFTVSAQGRQIRPTDFLPRRILGEYLAWFLDQVRVRLPDHVRLTLHRGSATDMCAEPDGGLTISVSDGTVVQARYAFLTTGYTANTPPAGTGRGRGRHIPQPYPLPERTAQIVPGESMAVAGFGLSAIDVVSCLTVGRGGRFIEDAGQLTYLPSGREPAVLLYSRSGLPCRARPRVVEFGPRYRPLAFTPANIDALRDGGRALDFDGDLLPLVLTEMRIAYRRCQARLAGSAAALEAALDDAAGLAGLTALLDDVDARRDPFDARAAFDGSSDMLLDSSEAYQKWLGDVVESDLAEGVLGFARSPIKAGLDILRELRDTFRYAVDFGGLTEQSLDEFTRTTIPALNRAVVGPQYERHCELLALMAAGVVEVPFGPAPVVSWNERAERWTISSSRLAEPHSRDVDWLLSAYVDLPAVESSASPLLETLAGRGWIRPHRPASRYVHGIDVDRDQHPLDIHGQAHRRVWVLGPLCEGATFYNNLVPSPNTYSRPVFDAHRCVAAMFAADSSIEE